VTIRTIPREDACCRCTRAVPAGSRAGWDEWTRNVTCLSCADPVEPGEQAVPA